MTARYELLISAMQTASHAVTVTAMIAIALLLFRVVIRRSLDAPMIPVFFRNLMYNTADLMLLAVIYAPFVIAE